MNSLSRHLKSALVIGLVLVSFIFLFSSPSIPRSDVVYSTATDYSYTIFPAATNQEYNPPVVTHFIPNSTVVIEGSVCPNPIIGILDNIYANVTYTRPDGSTFTDSTTLAAEQYDYCSGGGDLVDSIIPDMEGTWQVQSTAYIDWGNGTLTDVGSNSISFTVGASGPNLVELTIVPIIVLIIVVAIVLFRRNRRIPPPPPN